MLQCCKRQNYEHTLFSREKGARSIIFHQNLPHGLKLEMQVCIKNHCIASLHNDWSKFQKCFWKIAEALIIKWLKPTREYHRNRKRINYAPLFLLNGNMLTTKHIFYEIIESQRTINFKHMTQCHINISQDIEITL